jgi:hypothetical protein
MRLRVWIEQRERRKGARVSRGKAALACPVCTGDHSQRRGAHRVEAEVSTALRSFARCARNSSRRRLSSATFALAPAASRCAKSSRSTSIALVYNF